MSFPARTVAAFALFVSGVARGGDVGARDAVFSEELLQAQTRAERVASAGVLGGVALAGIGAVLIPMDCRANQLGPADACNSGRLNAALITAGGVLAATGVTYLALAQPRQEEVLAAARAWAADRPDSGWQLRPRASAPCAPGHAAEVCEASPPPARSASSRPSVVQSRWLAPGVYMPLMIGASCAAAGAWYLAEWINYQRALGAPMGGGGPLAGASSPEEPKTLPGIVTGACTAASVGVALWVRFAGAARAPLPSNLQLHLGPGGLGLSGTFE